MNFEVPYQVTRSLPGRDQTVPLYALSISIENRDAKERLDVLMFERSPDECFAGQ